MAVDLPAKLFVPALSDHTQPGGGIQLVRATNPEGTNVPIAFTRMEYLQHFARATGMDKHNPPIGHVVLPTNELLEQLAVAGEPEVVIDPMQESEARLSYQANGVLARQQVDDAVFEIAKPASNLADEHLEQLRKVAKSLPHVVRVWLMQITVVEKDKEGAEAPAPRPLLVVEQDIGPDHDEYDESFMELGDQWCEGLPRGTAVDMLPHDAPPVKDNLLVECVVYTRG
ncbi:MAG: hypothetical protein IT463_07340 [Planctomycetes bacterium]|nr:hypothetical protein [Planctomycetota bacterium]